MKKVALVFLTITFLGCFITSAVTVKQLVSINNTHSIKQLDNQTTAQYLKLINSVKPATVAIQNDDSRINEVASSINNNMNIESLNIKISSIYSNLIKVA
ncbi:MAG: hypothetical protein GY756_21230 [bacterium]|nr:hypothetical protein [bacterium]